MEIIVISAVAAIIESTLAIQSVVADATKNPGAFVATGLNVLQIMVVKLPSLPA